MQIPFFDRIINIIKNLGGLTIKFGLAISVIALMFAGYKYFLSSNEIKKTHLALIFIIIGILIILLVFDIPGLLLEIFSSIF